MSAVLIVLFFSFIAVWINKLSINAAIPVNASGEAPVQEEAVFEMETTHFGEERLPDVLLDVPYLSQEGILPTGCEATSAAMVLNYWGVDISPEAFADALPCDYLFWEDGKLYGPDPNEYFVGSPFDPNGYGCFAPVIAHTIPRIDKSMTAKVLTDVPLAQLYETYVSKDIPVLIWCTINMLETTGGTAWTLPDGEQFVWPRNEHCIVLAGREGEEYICMDPYQSIGQSAIAKGLLEDRYEAMGGQAVVILPKDQG